MKFFYKHIIIVSLLTFLVSASLYSQELLSIKMSKDSILIGDQVEWSAKVNMPKGVTIKYDTLSNPVIEGVELIREYGLDTLSINKLATELEIKAIITSFDSGSYVLPNRTIYLFKDGMLSDSLVINGTKLEVTTIPIDTTTYKMYDIKGQFNYPVTFKEIIPWIGLVILIVLLTFVIYKIIKNRRENKTLFGKPIVKDPPHITALRNLDKIRGEKLWQNNKQKQYYTSITDTLRVYIEGRFGIKAMERTSGEILADLAKVKVDEAVYKEISELFTLSDLVKFAKCEATNSENENALPTAVRFVNTTFMQELEEDKKNG